MAALCLRLRGEARCVQLANAIGIQLLRADKLEESLTALLSISRGFPTSVFYKALASGALGEAYGVLVRGRQIRLAYEPARVRMWPSQAVRLHGERVVHRGDRLIERTKQRLHVWGQDRRLACRPRVKDDALDVRRCFAEPDRVL
jgi:hypothetical protein